MMDITSLRKSILEWLPLHEFQWTEESDPFAHFNIRVIDPHSHPVVPHLVVSKDMPNMLMLGLGIELPTGDADWVKAIRSPEFLYDLQIQLYHFPISFFFGPKVDDLQNIEFLRIFLTLDRSELSEEKLFNALSVVFRVGKLVGTKFYQTQHRIASEQEKRQIQNQSPQSQGIQAPPMSFSFNFANSNISQQSQVSSTTQLVKINAEQSKAIGTILEELEELLQSQKLTPTQKEELEPEVKRLRINSKKENPDAKKVAEVLRSAKDILDGVAAASGIMMRISQILGSLGGFV